MDQENLLESMLTCMHYDICDCSMKLTTDDGCRCCLPRLTHHHHRLDYYLNYPVVHCYFVQHLDLPGMVWSGQEEDVVFSSVSFAASPDEKWQFDLSSPVKPCNNRGGREGTISWCRCSVLCAVLCYMKKNYLLVLNVQMSPDDCLIICWLLVVGVVNMIDELKLIQGVVALQ